VVFEQRLFLLTESHYPGEFLSSSDPSPIPFPPLSEVVKKKLSQAERPFAGPPGLRSDVESFPSSSCESFPLFQGRDSGAESLLPPRLSPGESRFEINRNFFFLLRRFSLPLLPRGTSPPPRPDED